MARFIAFAWASLACLSVAFAQAPTPRPSPQATSTILVLGDSLSAEYGLPRGTGWVALLEKKLKEDRPQARPMPATLFNASISGETTAGGLARLPALLLAHQSSIVILELGGNDALRGMALGQTQENFKRMIALCKAASAKVLLLGMQIPPNMGAAYSQDFQALFPRLRSSVDGFVPFLLKGIADRPQASEFFQADGIHPTQAAQPLILGNVYPALKHLLR